MPKTKRVEQIWKEWFCMRCGKRQTGMNDIFCPKCWVDHNKAIADQQTATVVVEVPDE